MLKKLGGTIVVLLALLIMPLIATLQEAKADLGDPDFNSLQFRNRWVQQDRLVGKPGVTRGYTWGPAVAGTETIKSEGYKESPNGQRPVQYFDKGRMEINQPFSENRVTTGLLVRELVSGRRQDGDNAFTDLAPSKTQVAGDDVSVNGDAPVYASFQNLITFGIPDSQSKPSTPAALISQQIDKSGQLSTINPPENLVIGTYQPETGHNIAKVFEDFKNQQGPTTDPFTNTDLTNQPVYTNQPTVNVFGYAVTEPYWVRTKIAGTTQTVLVQLFQRRVLTYNPALATNKVEMGNLGQHYYRWRYIENSATAFPTPSVNSSGCLTPTSASTAVQACVTDFSPAKGTNVTVYGRLIVGGQAISGVKMNTSWEYFSRVDTCTSDPSDSNGVARCTLNIGNDSAGYQVTVTVTFTYNGVTYRNEIEFKPV